jgi:hypothetical protein
MLIRVKPNALWTITPRAGIPPGTGIAPKVGAPNPHAVTAASWDGVIAALVVRDRTRISRTR